jgi:hypothetical protein
VITAKYANGSVPRYCQIAAIIRLGHDFRVLDIPQGRVSRLSVTPEFGIESFIDEQGRDPASSAIFAHPTRQPHYFVGGRQSIRLTNGTTIPLRFLDNGPVYFILGGVCTSDGAKLYATGLRPNVLCAIDTSSCLASIIAGRSHTDDNDRGSRDGKGADCRINNPRKLVFDRRPTVKSESVLFITSYFAIRRFDIESAEMTRVPLKYSAPLDPYAIECTASGMLIFGCLATSCIYAVDPAISTVERIAGTGCVGTADGKALTEATFYRILDVCLDESARRLWFVSPDRIGSFELPPDLFSSDVNS